MRNKIYLEINQLVLISKYKNNIFFGRASEKIILMIPSISSLYLHKLLRQLTSDAPMSHKVLYFINYCEYIAKSPPKECTAIPSAHKTLLRTTVSHLRIDQVIKLLAERYPESPKANAIVAELLAMLEIHPLLLADAWEHCDHEQKNSIINTLLSAGSKEFLRYTAIILRKPAHIHNYLLSDTTSERNMINIIQMLCHKECRFFRRVYFDIQQVGILMGALHMKAPPGATLHFLNALNRLLNAHEANNAPYSEAASLLRQIKNLQEIYQSDLFDLFCFQLILWVKSDNQTETSSVEQITTPITEHPPIEIEPPSIDRPASIVTFYRSPVEPPIDRLPPARNSRLG